jgi:hypothetical protein
MRSITKRLTVINDGFAKSKISADERIQKVISRYLLKMAKKGWKQSGPVLCGNAFKYYEAYVHLYK